MDFDKLSNAGEMSKQIEATAEKAILRLIRTHHMAAESIQAAMEAIDTEANQKILKQEEILMIRLIMVFLLVMI